MTLLNSIKKYNIFRPLIAGALLCSLSGCAMPRNVAVSMNPLSLGSVHQARIEAIYPIFIPGGVTFNRYSQTSAEAGSLIAEAAFVGSQWQTQLTQLSGSAAGAASGAYEERFNGSFCQYFVSTRDPDLVELSREDRGDDSLLEDILENELEQLRFQTSNLTINFESALFDFQLSSQALSENLNNATQNGVTPEFESIRNDLERQTELAKEQVDLLSDLLAANRSSIQAVERRMQAPEAIDTTILVINNPCRDFALGSTVLVSAVPNIAEFSIQPLYPNIQDQG